MPGDNDNPPYERGIEAIHDGWRLFQSSQLEQHPRGDEYRTGYLKYEFFFEKIKCAWERADVKNFLSGTFYGHFESALDSQFQNNYFEP